MTPLERMKADAKLCNAKLKTNKKVIHTPHETKSKDAIERSVRSGDGWRNSRLTKKELSDIKYFLSLGWDIGSTSVMCGVSYSTVQKIKNS